MLLVNTFEGQSPPHSRVPPGDDVYDPLGSAALEDSLALLSWLVLNVELAYGFRKSVLLLLQAAEYATAISAWLILYIPAPAASPAPPPRTPTLPRMHRSVSDGGAPYAGGGPRDYRGCGARADAAHGFAASKFKAKGKQQKERNPLQVVIMNVTLDAKKFSSFFFDAKIIYVKGRSTSTNHRATSSFLPGREDIESLRKAIELLARQLRSARRTMYVTLQGAQTNRVFAAPPRGACKCIVATNIAGRSIVGTAHPLPPRCESSAPRRRRTMTAFPLEPAHVRALTASKGLACTAEVLDNVSLLAPERRSSSTRRSNAARLQTRGANSRTALSGATAQAGDGDGGEKGIGCRRILSMSGYCARQHGSGISCVSVALGLADELRGQPVRFWISEVSVRLSRCAQRQ
ncbi:hypothetical protein B0H11DRAFT_2235892 [Mycena galericulata]|nr:hypothetical protein B0H11DRAFT_2235892 [Mycena galericulata]